MIDTLDPKTLNAEERALLDRHASKLYAEQPGSGGDAAGAYADGLRLIEARRALLSPAQPEPKREEVCPNCKKPANSVDGHLDLPGFAYLCQPAPPPAPVASELPEAVEEAALALRLAVNPCDGSPSDERLLSAADALEAWARSQQAADASSMWDKGFAAGIALQEKCDAQSKAVPGPVVPQLEGLHAKRCSEGHHPIYMHQDLYCPACVANRRLEERIADGQLLRAQLAAAQEDRERIVSAVLDYKRSEGCGCCSGQDHDKNKEALGEAIGAPLYSDGSGRDFGTLREARLAHRSGVLREEHESEVADLRARLEAAENRNSKWRSAFERARDMVLYERGPLEGESPGSDFINAVLGIFDDEFSEVVPPVPPPEAGR